MWDLIVSVPDHCLSFYFENLSYVMRKHVYAICEQQRRKTACAFAPSDQRLCFSLPG